MKNKKFYFSFRLNAFGILFLSLFLNNCNPGPTELIADDPMTEGSFLPSFIGDPASQVYTFNAGADRLYAIVWDDSLDGSGGNTADIKISVTNPGVTPAEDQCLANILNSEACNYASSSQISIIDQWSGESMTKLDNGYSKLRLLATGAIAETFEIEVECGNCMSSKDSKNYGIQIISMSSSLIPGGGYVEGTLTQRTPSPDSTIFAYNIPTTPYTNYSVQINDAADGTGAYFQDVHEFTVYGNPTSFALLSSGASSTYTTPDTFNPNSFSSVFVWVALTSNAATGTGYAIQVY